MCGVTGSSRTDLLSGVSATVQPVITVTAHTQTRPSPARDAPTPERGEITVQADSFEAGKLLALEQLPDGWIVSAWLVDRGGADAS